MNAGRKWVQLLLDILSYEFDEGPFLSDGAHALVDRHPILGRVLIISACGVLTAHLAKVVDPRYDLLHLVVAKGKI